MKKFGYQLLIFGLIPIIYCGTIHLINRCTYHNQNVDLQKARLLIMGDSHPLYSLDPDGLRKAANISQDGESYIITYWKLKKILETNRIDLLLLGFAPHNVSSFNDEKFVDRGWAYEMFKRTYPIEQYNSLKDKIALDLEIYLKVLFYETCLYPKRNHVNYIGEYNNSKFSDLSNWLGPVKRHFYHDDQARGISQTAIQHLDSIILLCNKNNILLGLVNSPVHKDYLQHIPNKIMNEYIALQDKYREADILIIDKFKNEYPDTFFLNPDHTNHYGAEKFTIEVKSILAEE